MATRKKKQLTVDGHGDVHEIIMSADVAEMVNVPSGGWPKINQGSHLTVKTFEDGHTELIWDDEALARDVREAIASVENKGDTNVKTKKTRKSK
jgi:uncharacterized membrane protein